MRTLACLALISFPAIAQTVYSWEDADGVHYTDDLSQVPKKGKVEAQLIDAAPSRPAKGQEAGAQTTAAAPSAPPPAANDERAWRDRFIGANRRISTLKQEVAALQASLPARTECVPQPSVTSQVQTSGGTVIITPGATTAAGTVVVQQPTTQCQVNPLHDRIRLRIEQKKVELRDAELDLEQLDRQASYDAVPREWRRGW